MDAHRCAREASGREGMRKGSCGKTQQVNVNSRCAWEASGRKEMRKECYGTMQGPSRASARACEGQGRVRAYITQARAFHMLFPAQAGVEVSDGIHPKKCNVLNMLPPSADRGIGNVVFTNGAIHADSEPQFHISVVTVCIDHPF